MGTTTVRAPRAEDNQPLVDVYVKARRSYYEGHVPEDELAEWERELRATGFRFDGPDRSWLCAEVDGEPVGFSLTTPDGHLLQLQVDPAHWGEGIGRALHDAAVDDLRRAGVRTAELEVFGENKRAQRFYTAHGWREVGRNEGHVRMALDLTV